MSWALITTQCNSEPSVVRVLAQKQIGHHHFLQRKKYVIRGSVVERLVPVFPRYIFVQPEDRWREIREIPGVCSFVRFGDAYPESVTDETVSALVNAAVADIFPTAEVPSKFKKGDCIRVVDGAMAGSIGKFERAIEHLRVVVLVPWSHRIVLMTIDERDIELHEAKPSLSQRKPRSGRWRRRHNRPVSATLAASVA